MTASFLFRPVLRLEEGVTRCWHLEEDGMLDPGSAACPLRFFCLEGFLMDTRI